MRLSMPVRNERVVKGDRTTVLCASWADLLEFCLQAVGETEDSA